MSELLEAMVEHHKAVEHGFARVEQRFEKRFDEAAFQVNRRFDAVDQRFDTMDQRFDAVDQRFDRMDRGKRR